MRADDWHSDLDALAEVLTSRHREPFHLTPREEFEAVVARLHERIPTLAETGILVGFDTVAATIGDGHTFVDTDHRYRRFPLELFWYSDRLCVVRSSSDDQRIPGAEVVAIGGVEVGAIELRLQSQIAQGENAWYVRDHSAERMTRADVLVALRCLPAAASGDFTFRAADGSRFTTTLHSLSPGTSPAWPDSSPGAAIRWQRPDDPLAYTALRDAAYVNFRSYDGLDHTGPAMIARLREDDPSRLIVDLRDNDGGNFTLARDHLVYRIWRMSRINRPGGLYVLIGRKTFSAAMVTATDFRRETEAVLVGEPTGARPVGYQELGTAELPRSGLLAHYATRHYRFADSDLAAVFPNQRIDPSTDQMGSDPVLDWCVAQPI